MSNQWGFPICEDGYVGRGVVTLGIPDDATGLNNGYRRRFLTNSHRIRPIS